LKLIKKCVVCYMIDVPKKIMVGPYQYGVELSAGLAADEDSDGQTDFRKETISLEPRNSNRRMAQTMFHEIQHTIFELIGEKEACLNEDLVDRNASTWLSVLINTPGFLEYLVQIRDET